MILNRCSVGVWELWKGKGWGGGRYGEVRNQGQSWGKMKLIFYVGTMKTETNLVMESRKRMTRGISRNKLVDNRIGDGKGIRIWLRSSFK